MHDRHDVVEAIDSATYLLTYDQFTRWDPDMTDTTTNSLCHVLPWMAGADSGPAAVMLRSSGVVHTEITQN